MSTQYHCLQDKIPVQWSLRCISEYLISLLPVEIYRLHFARFPNSPGLGADVRLGQMDRETLFWKSHRLLLLGIELQCTPSLYAVPVVMSFHIQLPYFRR